MSQKKEIIVLSLGGSIVVPDEVNVKFLKQFKKLIVENIKLGRRFIMVVGGGRTCRKYNEAAKQVTKLTNDDLDWLGIHSTRLNAHLLRTIFRDHAHPAINTNPTEIFRFKEDILVGAGWRPGFSTDFDAVMLAKAYGAKQIINMTNIDYVYTADPKKSADAKPVLNFTWPNYRKLVGSKWSPGSNAPFDPIASKKAQANGLKVIILNGNNLVNFNHCLAGKKFKGTIIDS